MSVSQHIKAPRNKVYGALLDPAAVAVWKVPGGMTCTVHSFEPKEGGSFRISLTYDGKESGKTRGHTDTYHGYFKRLVPNEQVVEVTEFETDDPELMGEMTLTTDLTDSDGGTKVTMSFESLPDGVSRADNETGTRMSLAKLAKLVETDITRR